MIEMPTGGTVERGAATRAEGDGEATPAGGGHAASVGLWLLQMALRAALPIVSILGLWYLAIYFSGLPAFVIPRPERVLQTLVNDRSFITIHLVETLKVALIGFILSNVIGIGLAVLFLAFPPGRQVIMPAAITLRNMPYVALVT